MRPEPEEQLLDWQMAKVMQRHRDEAAVQHMQNGVLGSAGYVSTGSHFAVSCGSNARSSVVLEG